MEHSNPTLAKIPILDTGKFEQWKFRIQQYLQNEHYALREVIEFGDSYEAPQDDAATGLASEGSAKRREGQLQLLLKICRRGGMIGNGEVNTASIPTTITQVFPTSANVTAASINLDTACAYIASQSNEEDWEKDFHSREPRSQEKGRKENYRQGSKEEEQAPKSLMAIDEVGWDWSYMENEEEDHALVADQEAPTEFALMAKSNSDTEVEARQVDFKNQEIKFYENIRGLEFKVESKSNRIKGLTNELEMLKKEKEGLDSKVIGLPEFADDTITDYSRPSPSIESNSSDLQNSDSSIVENEESFESIMSKSMIKFVKATDSPTVIKTNKDKTIRKPFVKYAKLYRKTSKSSNVSGKTWAKNNYIRKSRLPRTIFHKTDRTPAAVNRPHMNVAESKGTYFSKLAHSYVSRLVQRKSTVRTQFRVPRVSTGNTKFPTVNKNFPTGNSKLSTADLGNKGKAWLLSKHDWQQNPIFLIMSLLMEDMCHLVKEDARLLVKEQSKLDTRQHNMYSIDLNNIVPYKYLTCLVTKASTDESELWHRRLGHLNFKTMNKLVRHNLVRGLLSKCFENDHTFTACLKGKQHKASCKPKLVHLVSKPLHTLHIDLFGPTYVSSLYHQWYCLVVTDDFSRFTWTFFLKTKDETSGILWNFITEIENLKDLKVKIIRCDNGGEFRNKEMNDFCSRKGIKREFNNARTPQQNGVAERRNKTLIEAARTMLADAKLPITFWDEAVNTACYVQNRVLVNKTQNKTLYELFNGRTPAIGFLKPFECHVMILNTLDNLEKFEAKGDEGYFIRYSMSSKAFRVFNKRTKRVEENLHVDFLENKLIEKGASPNWLFDIVTLTNSMNYEPVVSAETTSTNFSVENPIPTISSHVLTACLNDSPQLSSDSRLISKRVTSQDGIPSLDNILTLTNRCEDILGVTTNLGDTNGVEADLSNMENNISASPTPTFRIYKDNLTSQIIGPVDTPVQTRNKSKEMEEQSFIASIHRKTNLDLLQICLFSCFLSQEEPKKISDALKDPIYQMDVKSAFLYGTIDEKVYVMQPLGFQDLKFPTRVYKVEKAMYGLHQAPRAWTKTTDEGTKILATVDGKPRTTSESSIMRNIKLKDEAGISSLPDAELFENLTLMGYNISPNQSFTFQKGQFSHQWKYLIHTIMQCLCLKCTSFNEFSSNIATAVGEGSGTPTEPHHTPSPEATQSPQQELSSPSLPPVITKIIPTLIPTDKPPLRQYSRRARISQSSALPTAAEEPASPLGDASQGEACPTVFGLEARQDRANIIKSSTLPYDSTPRLKIWKKASLKARIKMLEDKDEEVDEPSGEDAIIKGRSLETGEETGVDKSTERGMVSIPPAAEVSTVSVPPATEIPTVSVPTNSGMVSTASPIFTTASVVTPYSRRKGKEKMVESETPKKKKIQEQIDLQMAREMEEQMIREDQRRSEQIARDAKIARIHAKEELQMMIAGLVRNNETIAKQLCKGSQVPVSAKEATLQEATKRILYIDGEKEYWKIIRLGGHTAVYKFFVNMLRQLDREDLSQLWTLMKETLSIRQATNDKEKEL
uniref:Putative ribonuclease H-like domain-containing protein n=1 Tax=Tanacetum cinerariifolium TaxID=118510 RepID=A0A6L2N6Z6_TANCI|nr:putative ribonuclease H-like domain-containing protein [Tanacetum cinerariifolium]